MRAVQDIAADTAEHGARILKGQRCEPELPGSDVAQYLDGCDLDRPVDVAGRIQGGCRGPEVQGQSALPCPEAIELPPSKQRVAHTAGRPLLAGTEGKFVSSTPGQDVAPV